MNMPCSKWAILAVASLGTLLLFAPGGCAKPQVRQGAWSETFQHGAVAADHAVASRAGAEMLVKGGNAVDAAVATSFTLSVVRPYSCGIGGGGFMVVYLPARGKSPAAKVAINYRETAPAAVGPDFYEKIEDRSASVRGALAVGVPGTVRGLLHALDKYGTLDRAEVMAPAIRAAEEGFEVDAHYVESARGVIDDFERNPDWKQRFVFVWERYLLRGSVKVGDRIVNPEQAAALRLIARDGDRAFYEGEIGASIVRAIERDRGVMTAGDLRAYALRESEPLTFEFDAGNGFKGKSKTFVTMPPPSSGGVAMGQSLGLFSTRKNSMGLSKEPFRNEQFWLVECFKHAFADRAEYLGDPAFVDVPVTRLLARETIDAIASGGGWTPGMPVQDRYGMRAVDRRGPRAVPKDDGGTSHLCAVDLWGGAVSCTETINLEFGSLLAVPEFGFCLNDEMDDFTTRRGEPNEYGLRQSDRNLPAPGKRPLSSMTPTIVLDSRGRVEAIAGGSGGPRIITGTTQVLLNLLLRDCCAEHAVARGRLHHQWMPDVVRLERAWVEKGQGKYLLDAFRSTEQNVDVVDAVANVQLIKRGGIGWQAASDPRKGGLPAGH